MSQPGLLHVDGGSIPATLGASIARRDERVIPICGDGAFQMTGNGLSTIIRNGFSPVIIVLDNHGYGTEGFLHPGEWEYNEIHPWQYHKLPEIYGGGCGHLVSTEGEFVDALDREIADTGNLHLIHERLKEGDASQTLLQLVNRLGQRVKGAE